VQQCSYLGRAGDRITQQVARVVAFELLKVVQIVDHHAVTAAQAIGAEVCEGVDTMQLSTVAQMEVGDAVERQLAPFLEQQISSTQALEDRRQAHEDLASGR